LAASILAISIALQMSRPDAATTPVADYTPRVEHPQAGLTPAAEQVNWPEILDTLDQFPRRLEELGPFYLCTAQMTGVSSLTSPWSLTVDLLRSRLNRGTPLKNDGSDSSGRNDRPAMLNLPA
jgi:hypothetical protein